MIILIGAGRSLEYVKDQTPEICLEAVKQEGVSLYYVKKKTHEICLEAVRRDGKALQFVKNQTPTICLEAVKHNWNTLEHVKEIKLKTSLLIKHKTNFEINPKNSKWWF